MITIIYKIFAKLISIVSILKIGQTPYIRIVSMNGDRSPKFTTRKTFAIYCARKLHATSAAKYSRVPVVTDVQR